MSEIQQIFFFMMLMVWQLVFPWLVSFGVAFFPRDDGADAERSAVGTAWYQNLDAGRVASLFAAGVGYSGLTATLFASSFTLALTIGNVGGAYNVLVNRNIEKSIG